MRLHQVRLRKDGPVHAVEHKGGDEYASFTLCGAHISFIDRPERRRFAAAEHRCKRCTKSEALLV